MIFNYSIIGIGSNNKDKLNNLVLAVNFLKNHLYIDVIKIASVYFSNAQLPDNAPKNWNKDFLNSAVLIQTSLSPNHLLLELKKIETQMGREKAPDWSPRVIDLDILLFGDVKIKTQDLCVPHEHLLSRPFALMPAYEIIPDDMREYFLQDDYNKINKIIELWVKDKNKNKNKNNIPFDTQKIKQRIDTKQLMKIINVTPDSFASVNYLDNKNLDIKQDINQDIKQDINQAILQGAHIIDIGAEATNPSIGKKSISIETQWSRLEPVLKYISKNKKKWSNKYNLKISLDTRNHEILKRALDLKSVDILNDVSGLRCYNMQNLVKESGIDAVFMHSLSVPADKQNIVSYNKDVVNYILSWAKSHLDELLNIGISKDKLIFDPGIGFGNNSLQALQLMQRFIEFKQLDIKLLLGHSRKSWTNQFISSNNNNIIEQKDKLTNLQSLLNSGADILRLHNISLF